MVIKFIYLSFGLFDGFLESVLLQNGRSPRHLLLLLARSLLLLLALLFPFLGRLDLLARLGLLLLLSALQGQQHDLLLAPLHLIHRVLKGERLYL